MIRVLYRTLLRLPQFKGKARLEDAYRKIFLRPTIERVRAGILMELDPWEWTQIDLIRNGVVVKPVVDVLSSVLRPGDVFVDAGAHIGCSTLAGRERVGPGGRVIAIEPQPYNSQRLLRNAYLNDFRNIEVHLAVLGREEKTVALAYQSVTDSARLSLRLDAEHDHPQRFVVPMRRLDHLLAEARVDSARLLKLDVRGYELEVLEGLGNLLAAFDYFIVEILEPQSESARSVVRLFRDARYQLQTVTGADWAPGSPLPSNHLVAVRTGLVTP
jgi:FkbM family methyltransferase